MSGALNRLLCFSLATDAAVEQPRCVDVPTVDDRTCMDWLIGTPIWGPGMICAGQENSDNCLVSGATSGN